jgi:hypothetical protein
MSTENPGSTPATGASEEPPPAPPDEPTDDAGVRADDSVLGDVPDTTTGKEHLLQNDETGPGPGV